MQKLISLRFSGTCKKCGERIPAGSQAMWFGRRDGVSHYPHCKEEPKQEIKKIPETQSPVFQIDYGTVRDAYLARINGTPSNEIVSRRTNQQELDGIARLWQENWSGATTDQMKAWIHSGFHVPGIENVNPDLLPNRQRRKLKFGEDGELQLDMVYSGFDYPFLEWEKRERKPGMTVEIGYGFSANMKAETLAHYERWVAQVISTLEESGYDLEVNVTCNVRGSWTSDYGKIQKTIIRVKRENEASDFAEWSALFSPGGYRHLVFTAQTLAADELGKDMDEGYGNNPGSFEWGVSLDEETRVLTISNPWNPDSFPEARMTEEFTKIIPE